MFDYRPLPTQGQVLLSNRSCRLSPTPPIMKMAVGAIRESPLREIGRGLFSEESSMQACRLHIEG